MDVGRPKRVYTIEPIVDPIRRIQERPAPAPPREPAPLPERRERVGEP
jgi:hypothetical protein